MLFESDIQEKKHIYITFLFLGGRIYLLIT